MMLSMPDEMIRARAKADRPDWSEDQLDALIQYVQKQRDAEPYLVSPAKIGPEGGELIQFSTGESYETAKITAALSDSFLVTDLRARWREIELDRSEAGIDPLQWSPFAKAFNGLPFKYLNNVPIAAALTLRREQRLEGLRAFLRKSWHLTSSAENPFDSANAADFGAELVQRVNEAEAEWKKIDEDLLKWFGTEMMVGAVPAIATGNAAWVGAAVVGAVASLAVAASRRSAFPKRYPASFLLELEQTASNE